MKTELVFKLEGNPTGYGQKFAPNVKVEIKAEKGFLYLDYNRRYLMGHFSNLRRDGEVLLADIDILNDHRLIEHRLEYAIAGKVVSKNEKDECTHLIVEEVAALMPSVY